MPLRLGVDLDGVLADMEGRLLREATALFGAARPPAEKESAEQGIEDAIAAAADPDNVALPPRLELTVRQQRRLWDHVRATENFWETLDETEPGVVKRLGELAAGRAWEVIFLTKRPGTRGATSQRQSQQWLTRNGFELPSVYVVNGSRGRIAAALALDVIVDDTPDNCLAAATESKALVIGVFRSLPATPPALRSLGIRGVRTATDALALLCEIDDRAQPASGPLGWVKRLMGVKPPPAAQT